MVCKCPAPGRRVLKFQGAENACPSLLLLAMGVAKDALGGGDRAVMGRDAPRSTSDERTG